MNTDRWPLFDFFPSLRETLGPVELCDLPSPIFCADTFSDNAWIKRDDENADEYGGNRMRKLEFMLADIRRLKARHVVLLCASDSHTAVATAAICQRENLRCDVITFDVNSQQCTSEVERTRSQLEYYGANVVAQSSLYLALAYWLLHPLRLRKDSYFLRAGSVPPAAVYAHINAALELAMQVDRGECPMPKHIVVAAGSGATVAGLSLGASLALPGCTVHAVQVAPATLGPLELCNAMAVHRLRQKIWNEMIEHAPALQAEPDDNLVWHSNYFGDGCGGGYGVGTLKSRLAMERAGRIGLALNAAFTGKAFAAFCDLLTQNDEPTLFWSTANHGHYEQPQAEGVGMRPAPSCLGQDSFIEDKDSVILSAYKSTI